MGGVTKSKRTREKFLLDRVSRVTDDENKMIVLFLDAVLP
jgi:hypothetical protein